MEARTKPEANPGKVSPPKNVPESVNTSTPKGRGLRQQKRSVDPSARLKKSFPGGRYRAQKKCFHGRPQAGSRNTQDAEDGRSRRSSGRLLFISKSFQGQSRFSHWLTRIRHQEGIDASPQNAASRPLSQSKAIRPVDEEAFDRSKFKDRAANTRGRIWPAGAFPKPFCPPNHDEKLRPILTKNR